MGEDEAGVIAHLRVALEGSPERTLAGLSEIDATRAAGAIAGGFVTVAGANLLMLDDTRDEHLTAAMDVVESLRVLPGRGETLIPFLLITEDTPKGGARMRAHTRLPITAIADIVKLAGR
jgi:hypothetical protein